MGLRFILGRAGTGKTHACLEEIREGLRRFPQGGSSLIFLVPEQATFQAERALISASGVAGVIRAQVLSFRRLAWRVLQEVGGSARIPIGELGKRMVLRQLLESRKHELRVFHRSASQPGFTEALAGAILELKLYSVDVDALSYCQTRMTEHLGGNLLTDKLHDLSVIYQAMTEFLADKYTDPDDYLYLLAQRVHQSGFLRGAEVWVDGFAGFTPQELKVLAALLEVTTRVNVALCLDWNQLKHPMDVTSPFFRTQDTYAKLMQLAVDRQMEIEASLKLGGQEPYCSAPRFRNAPELQYLETAFFDSSASKMIERTPGLAIYAAVNRRSEIEGVAREIISLCREEGYRWREVAVVLRDMEPYHELLATVFQDFGIPFFLDRKRSVHHHPLIELIRSALEVVLRDWSYEPVFRFLKTDMVPIERDEVDRLENYVLAHGIRGYRWRDRHPWAYRRRYTLGEADSLNNEEIADLVAVNEARERARKHLMGFHRAVEQSTDVRLITTALYELLVHLGVPDRMAAWSQECEEAGKLEEARAHRQVWSGVVELFDQIVESLGQTPIDLTTYAVVIESGLDSLRLGLIPPELDQVLVGSLERSRSPEVKAAFIMGVSDGVLPARPGDDGIFDDGERERIKGLSGLELAPGSRRRLLDEQFLVYVALTRASEKCYISYPLADEEGRALQPSQVIARIKDLFPQVTQKLWLLEPESCSWNDYRQEAEANKKLAREYICHPRRSLSYLVNQFREVRAGRFIADVWWSVYSWFAGQPEWREKLRLTLAGLEHWNQEAGLPPSVSRKIYGQPLQASVTRIERFKACPFAHFASHGLRLEERPVFRLEAPDLGQFYHAALKMFGEELRKHRLDWGEIPQEKVVSLTGQIVASLAPQLQSEILLSSARYRYLTGRLQQTVLRAVSVLAEHARRGQFRPLGLEVGFGPQEELPPVQIPLSQGASMELVGRIDRVDGVSIHGRQFIRIIDYKSSKSDLKLADIYHGIKLQLLAYLDVALTHAGRLLGGQASTETLPGGLLYFGVRDPLMAASGPLSPDEAAKRMIKELKMSGMVLADPSVVFSMDNLIQGHSELIPVALKKDGGFYASSAVMTLEQFQRLRHHLQEVLRQVGDSILNGCVEIHPYQRANRVACRFCLYKPVCQFDLLLAENTYRPLIDEPPEVLWTKIGQGVIQN